jgi:hypothetical protein
MSSKTKHTPGPWVAETYDGFNDVRIESNNGPIAIVGTGKGEANAALIAAAPEMLEALEELYLTFRDEIAESSELEKMLQNIITKAKGGAE